SSWNATTSTNAQPSTSSAHTPATATASSPTSQTPSSTAADSSPAHPNRRHNHKPPSRLGGPLPMTPKRRVRAELLRAAGLRRPCRRPSLSLSRLRSSGRVGEAPYATSAVEAVLEARHATRQIHDLDCPRDLRGSQQHHALRR